MTDLKMYSLKELQELDNNIQKEIAKRQAEEYKKDYKNVLAALKIMAEKYPYDGEFDFYQYDGCGWEEVYTEIERMELD